MAAGTQRPFFTWEQRGKEAVRDRVCLDTMVPTNLQVQIPTAGHLEGPSVSTEWLVLMCERNVAWKNDDFV